MTNDEFKAWRERFFASRASAAAYLDLSRDTIDALETGATRRGEPYPVRHHMALSCLAVATGRVIVPSRFAAPTAATVPAPGRRLAAQTEAILARADGRLTVAQIAAELRIEPKAVYAAVERARKKGTAVTVKPDAKRPRHPEG